MTCKLDGSFNRTVKGVAANGRAYQNKTGIPVHKNLTKE
jgi:hypothetical protein